MPRGQDGAPALELPVAAGEFAVRLLVWYQQNKRDLPWRGETDPYRIWLSEVMLQQTQVATALPYYQRFLKRFPSLPDLASADLSEVLAEWAGLGYYSRARNLHQAAQILCRRHQGRFPSDYRQALQLPGVGRYTAGAVLSIAYGQALPILDGNIRRLLIRYLALDQPAGSAVPALWKLLEDLVSRPQISTQIVAFNQALMELGALICTPRSPECGQCPLESSCQARQAGLQAELPRPPRTRGVVHLHFLAALVRRGRELLLRRNEEGPFLRGFWEVPKIEGSDSSRFSGEIQQRWGLDLIVQEELPVLRHQITRHQLHFTPLLCELGSTGLPNGWIWGDSSRRDLALPAYVRKLARLVPAR